MKNIEQLKEQEKEKKTEKLWKLSQCNMPAAIVLSLFFPIGGYALTKRWMAFLWYFMISGFATFILVSSQPYEDDAFDTFLGCSFLSSIAASIDNGSAVSRARQRVKDLGLEA